MFERSTAAPAESLTATCNHCYGTGIDDDLKMKCLHCHGSGAKLTRSGIVFYAAMKHAIPQPVDLGGLYGSVHAIQEAHIRLMDRIELLEAKGKAR